MSAGTALFIALFVTVLVVMTIVHFRIMRRRRTQGTPLLRVEKAVAVGTRYAFSVPEGVGEVDFFLRHRRGPPVEVAIALRVHGPVSREFELEIAGVWGEHREVLSGVVPGNYEVELVGAAAAELTELLAVGHPAR